MSPCRQRPALAFDEINQGITELPVAFGSLFVHVSYLSERYDLGRGAVKYLLHENHFGATRFEKINYEKLGFWDSSRLSNICFEAWQAQSLRIIKQMSSRWVSTRHIL